jgi:hypothetical protein
MSLSIDDQLTLTEILCVLLGIFITWAAFYGSEEAELPGTAPIPDPNVPDDYHYPVEGRSLR